MMRETNRYLFNVYLLMGLDWMGGRHCCTHFTGGVSEAHGGHVTPPGLWQSWVWDLSSLTQAGFS